ncbi:hypothetical protein ASG29_07280 [Sphingomonas sp. Leaf412]|uniref:hypothetical protein n=1 Tax=Sphingomonas sp. Leaf412 TaxID=1736370 RepID=UPI0006F40F4B|nr:hypothetical protein [Sphingomonas sp. Leaf412]KQT31722.1 hypothetical protein ASG29_07280 [Sphingomonas sp. Leaf412]
MLFTTPTQWFAVAVALVAGWLFGLASHPGGKKWKARYLAERDAHADTTKRATELERDRGTWDRERTDWERQRADWERDRAERERERAAAPVVVEERPVAASSLGTGGIFSRPAADPAVRDEDRDRRI